MTGGSGFLGQQVVRHFAAHDYDIRLLIREKRGNDYQFPTNVETVRGDISDPLIVKSCAEDCEAIIHMAALTKRWSRSKQVFHDVNVTGTWNILDAAIEKKVERVLITSTFLALKPSNEKAGAEIEPAKEDTLYNAYQQTKWESLKITEDCRRKGLPINILFPGVIYGPGAVRESNIVGNLIHDHENGKLAGIIGDGSHIWSFVHTDDVAKGYLLVLEKAAPGCDYILGGENTSLKNLYDLIMEISGKKIRYRKIPFWQLYLGGMIEEIKARLSGIPPRLTREEVSIYRHNWALDSTRAIRDLGYKITPLKTGLVQTFQWLRDNGII